MKYWKRKVMSLSREEIAAAIDDDHWQAFRKGLKGLPTARKLDELEYYLKAIDPAALPAERHMVRVRVDNYINALLRGGQLRRICNEMLVVAK